MSTPLWPPASGIGVVADDHARWKHGPVEQARAACAGGAVWVQLRAKSATDTEVLGWAREIRALTRAAGIPFFVNDRFDLALLAGADGVHLGQDDVPPDRLPAEARARLRIGRSTHDEEQLERARREPIDYVAFGPVFGTASKASPYAARGIGALARAARAVAPLPLVAIGGIDAERAAEVAAAGAAAAAVIGAVAGADEPEAAVRELAEAFASGRA